MLQKFKENFQGFGEMRFLYLDTFSGKKIELVVSAVLG